MGKKYTTDEIHVGGHNLDASMMVTLNSLADAGLHSNAGYLTTYTDTNTQLTSAQIAGMGYLSTATGLEVFRSEKNIDDQGTYMFAQDDGGWTGGNRLAGAHNGYGVISMHLHSGSYYGQIHLSSQTSDMGIRFQENSATWGTIYTVHTSKHFSTADVADGKTAHGWGNHSGLYLPINNPTLTGVLTLPQHLKATGTNLSFSAGGNQILNIDLNGKIYPSTDASSDLGFTATSNRFRHGNFSGTVTSGTVTATSSSRAPIFYDSNNTGYYLNPASTSTVNQVDFAGYSSANGGFQVKRNLGTTAPSWETDKHTLSLENSDAGYLSINFHRAGYTSHNIKYTGTEFITDDSWVSTIDMRAPSFYDSDNTGYYLNPASTTRLNALDVVGSSNFGQTTVNNNDLKVDNGRVLITNSAATGGGDFNPALLAYTATEQAYGRAQVLLASGYSDITIGSSQANDNHGSTLTFATVNPANGADYRKFVIGQGNWGVRSGFLDFGYDGGSESQNPHSYINSSDVSFTVDGLNNRVGLNSMSPTHTLDVNGDAHISTTLTAASSLRAPIFYDSNNTGYYLNPASTSNLNGLTVAATITGNISGNAGTAGNADTVDGHHASTTRNSANTIPIRDAYGYINLGWINTTSGNTNSTLSDIYVNTNDGYIRKATPAHFRSQITDGNYLPIGGKAADSNLLDGLNSTNYMRDNGWNNNPGQDADTQPTMSSDFTYSNNAPHTGDLIRFGSSGYSLQLNATYNDTTGGLSFRSFNNDSAQTWNPWRTIYHSGNFNPSSYLTTGGKAADSNLLDGIDSASFLRSNDHDSFSGTLTGSAQRMMEPNDYGKGVYGKYSSTRFQHVWGMGSSWHMSTNGTSLGNFYGIAYTHSNVGTGSQSGFSHQTLFVEDGVPRTWIGQGVRTVGDLISDTSIKAPNFYDLDNTGYYVNPAGTSRLGYAHFDGYSDTSGNARTTTGVSLGRYTSEYAHIDIASSHGSGGWIDFSDASGGDYGGRIRYHNSSEYMSFYAGGTNEEFRINSSYTTSLGSSRAPVFYDNDNTNYFLNPASTSRLNLLTDYRGNYATHHIQSGSDFANGTLVTTNINANVTNGDSYIIEVTGKSYSSNSEPFSWIGQGYLYNNTIISHSAISQTGIAPDYMKVFKHSDDKLAFWWPRYSYWNSFEVRVRRASGNSAAYNAVTSIVNSAEPSSDKKVQTNIAKVWTPRTLQNVSQLANDSGYLTSLPSHTHNYAPSVHNHDDRYYTETEINAQNVNLNETLAALSGWVPGFSNSDDSSLTWDRIEDALRIKSSSDSTIGAVYKAMRVKDGQTIRVTVTVKGDVPGSDGLYLRLQKHDGDLPDGKTHISNDESGSSVFVQEDDSEVNTWYENSAISTSWVTHKKDITITGDGYISFLVLNWAGNSTNSIWVKTPDIQIVSSPYLPLSGGTLTGDLIVQGLSEFHSNSIFDYDVSVAGTLSSYLGNISYLGINTTPNTSGSYRLKVKGNIDMAGGGVDYVNQLHFQDNVRFYDDGNDSYLNFKYGDTNDGGIKIINGSGVHKGRLYADNGGFGLLDSDSQWAVRTQTGTNPLELRCDNNVEFQVYNSYTLSPGSSRAPIFYDSNNTGYYLNPASTSTLNRVNYINNSIPIVVKVNSGYKSWAHHISSNDDYVLAPSTTDGSETWDWNNGFNFKTTGDIMANNFLLRSDERLKTKITDLPCDNIDVAWKSFELKSDEGNYRTGVIAQELEKTNPEFVDTDDKGFKSVKYIDLLIAKIAELEARLEKLEK